MAGGVGSRLDGGRGKDGWEKREGDSWSGEAEWGGDPRAKPRVPEPVAPEPEEPEVAQKVTES